MDTKTNPTLTDALTFITSHASSDELDRVIDAVNQRNRALRMLAAAAVSVGVTGTLNDLRPKYLNGLRGEVVAISGQRCTLRLDAESTQLLAMAAPRYRFVATMDTYDLAGVPLSSVKVTD